MARMDRTVGRRQTATQADQQFDYWRKTTDRQRLETAMLLNGLAWRFEPEHPPKMDKSVFKKRKRMSNPVFFQEFLEFLQALQTQEVEYVLVGGYAVILHGYPRNTGDMDIWVNPSRENHERITRAFRQFGLPLFDMTLENFLDTGSFDVFTFGVPPIRIDLMTQVKGLAFREVFARAEFRDLEDDLSIRVISREDLLQAKRAAGRAKDFNDIRHLSGKEEE